MLPHGMQSVLRTPLTTGADSFKRVLGSTRTSLSIVSRAHEVQRDVRFIPDDPAVMGLGRNVKESAGGKFPNPAVIKRGRGSPLQNQPEMLDAAAVCAHGGTYIHGPAPPGFVGGATDRHAPDRNELEAPASEATDLVGRLETLENDIERRS